MRSFNHVNAKSLKEAVKLLKNHKSKAVVTAGGTDLMGVLKDEILPDYPETVINLKGIKDLDYIQADSKGVRIGAVTKLVDIVQSSKLKKDYGVLVDAAACVGSPMIRNMGTVGGNLCQDVRCWYYRYAHVVGGRMVCVRKGGDICYAESGDNRYHAIMGADDCYAVCPSDTAVALAALKAKVRIAGPKGYRVVLVEDFYETLGNVLEPDEIVTEIQISKPVDGARQVFNKFRLRKAIDFAIVSVGSVIAMEGGKCKEARIALGGVAPIPVRALGAEKALEGNTIDAVSAEKASDAAVEGAEPLDKNEYKVQIAKTLVKRTLLS